MELLPHKYELNTMMDPLKILIGMFEEIKGIKNPNRTDQYGEKHPKNLLDYQIVVSPIVIKATFSDRAAKVMSKFMNQFGDTYDVQIDSLERINGFLYNTRLASQMLDFQDIDDALSKYELPFVPMGDFHANLSKITIDSSKRLSLTSEFYNKLFMANLFLANSTLNYRMYTLSFNIQVENHSELPVFNTLSKFFIMRHSTKSSRNISNLKLKNNKIPDSETLIRMSDEISDLTAALKKL